MPLGVVLCDSAAQRHCSAECQVPRAQSLCINQEEKVRPTQDKVTETPVGEEIEKTTTSLTHLSGTPTVLLILFEIAPVGLTALHR